AVRPRRVPAAHDAGARDRHAPRPHEPGDGDRARGGRLTPLHDRRTGRQRRQRPDGRPLPAPGRQVMAYLLKGVSVLGAAPTDLVIEDGVISTKAAKNATVIDATGLVALPGLVDV